MSDDETRWDRFLDKHPRIDKIDTWMWRMKWRIKNGPQHWWEMRKWKVGTPFLEHGWLPSVIVKVDDDSLCSVSLVDGTHRCGCSVYHCGPLHTTWDEALETAREMREKRERGEDIYPWAPGEKEEYEKNWGPIADEGKR